MKLDFEEIKKEILSMNIKSEYKQASILIIRDVFKCESSKSMISSVDELTEDDDNYNLHEWKRG